MQHCHFLKSTVTLGTPPPPIKGPYVLCGPLTLTLMTDLTLTLMNYLTLTLQDQSNLSRPPS